GDEDTWNLETETLREDAITIEAIPNLSLNILGSRFKTPFIKFRPKGLASKPWEGRSIHFFNFRKLFLIELNGAPIYFRLKDLHGKTFPYQRIKDHGVKALIAKLKLQPLSNGKFGFKGQTRISHTPNNLNYWHSELSVCDQEQKIIKDTSNLWKKDAAGMAFAHIVTGSARRVIPSREPRIPKMHYKKD
ncbi:MAG TPA: hypothetical protein VFU05_17565, partial [Cyclobacteriaceae bacterium]|nr:hypothetical protein [Cyclobacteriaceae bacterium]